jgi:hypothetical protein
MKLNREDSLRLVLQLLFPDPPNEALLAAARRFRDTVAERAEMDDDFLRWLLREALE